MYTRYGMIYHLFMVVFFKQGKVMIQNVVFSKKVKEKAKIVSLVTQEFKSGSTCGQVCAQVKMRIGILYMAETFFLAYMKTFGIFSKNSTYFWNKMDLIVEVGLHRPIFIT